ncbi:MAG TPA: hypothetical protein PLY93_06330 [Turneriella sp.]|nr:hypothetical protein [Turneriella sp.]
MLTRVLFIFCVVTVSVTFLACGESYCKQYAAKFCTDPNTPACKTAQEKIKNWSSNECRIQFNNLIIEEQAKDTEKLLEE